LEVILFLLFLLVVAAFKSGPRPSKANSPESIGWQGELTVSNALRLGLKSAEYNAYHDVVLPIADGTTQIDHIVVSRYGVFVIETKNYKGWIFGSANRKFWTKTSYGRKYRFQNPLRQNYKHTRAVELFFSLKPSSVFSVIVFVGRSEFRTVLPSNVMSLGGLNTYIASKNLVLISDRKVAWIVDRLNRHKAGKPSLDNETSHVGIVN
jgi:restriction system protein